MLGNSRNLQICGLRSDTTYVVTLFLQRSIIYLSQSFLSISRHMRWRRIGSRRSLSVATESEDIDGRCTEHAPITLTHIPTHARGSAAHMRLNYAAAAANSDDISRYAPAWNRLQAHRKTPLRILFAWQTGFSVHAAYALFLSCICLSLAHLIHCQSAYITEF